MEMNIFATTIYGLIQGLAEFLPISSSGHLALLPKVLGIDDPGVAFDLAMHIGTGMAVVVYFRREIGAMFTGLWEMKSGKPNPMGYYALNILLSNVATFVIAIIFKNFAEKQARVPLVIAINLILFGLLMWVCDRFSKSEKKDETFMGKMAFKESLFMGLFQGVAVFPGVSRSGSTLAISRLLKIERSAAGRFSFMMSLPVIFGGMLLHLRNLPPHLHLAPLLWGIVVSFLAGLAAIRFFLYWVIGQGLGIFALYRLVIAIIILLVLY